MKITIGVTTYNRIGALKRMAKSLYASDLISEYSVRVYDDASTEYNINVLQDIFPNAEFIYRHKTNIGADKNMMYMYKDFLNSTNSDVFFNADSDMIFEKNWLEKGADLLKKSDGILSIYNTPHHKSIKETKDFIEKEHLGAAGTFFSRKALQYLFDNMEIEQLDTLAAVGADFGWSKFFKARGFHLYCTKESLVQHIGFAGYNNTLDNINYGTNFKVDSMINGQILNDVLYDISVTQQQSLRRVYALFPFELIPKGARVVLYGYANTGKDFEEQIKRSGYCELTGIVDEKKFDNINVMPPRALNEFDFDYLVLATIYEEVAESMRKFAKSIVQGIESKIIYKKNNALIRL